MTDLQLIFYIVLVVLIFKVLIFIFLWIIVKIYSIRFKLKGNSFLITLGIFLGYKTLKSILNKE